jgi:hypothetical protein
MMTVRHPALVALSMLTRKDIYGIPSNDHVFDVLDGAKEDWVNARGVAEYFALMLLSDDLRNA